MKNDNPSSRLKIFRKIIYSYKPNEFLNTNDFEIVLNLFKNHHNWKQKEGCGVEKIQVIQNYRKKLAFIIHRKDNSTTDISFIIAAKGTKEKDINRIKNACRQAIMPEILSFKNTINYSMDHCPITGEILTPENTHIDHYDLTFDEMFNRWIKCYNFEYLKTKLNDNSKDNIVYDKFTDNELIRDFIKFHNFYCKLRAVSKTANLSVLKKNKLEFKK